MGSSRQEEEVPSHVIVASVGRAADLACRLLGAWIELVCVVQDEYASRLALRTHVRLAFTSLAPRPLERRELSKDADAAAWCPANSRGDSATRDPEKTLRSSFLTFIERDPSQKGEKARP